MESNIAVLGLGALGLAAFAWIVNQAERTTPLPQSPPPTLPPLPEAQAPAPARVFMSSGRYASLDSYGRPGTYPSQLGPWSGPWEGESLGGRWRPLPPRPSLPPRQAGWLTSLPAGPRPAGRVSPEGYPLAYLGQLIEAVHGEGGRVYGLYVDTQRTYWFSDNNHNLIFLPQQREIEDGDQIHLPGHVGSFVVNLRSPYRYYAM